MSEQPARREPAGSSSELLLYQTDDKSTKIEVRLEGETVWLNQSQMAELFDSSKQNISLHIRNVFEEGELREGTTVKDYLTVQREGDRDVSRRVTHYNLDVIISVGYRVKSHQGTRFRVWATGRLREFLVKGFTLDDERLMQGGGPGRYFDELLDRVRAIRASERVFWQKVTDVYATSVDYDVDAPATRQFFASLQNKFHYAIHGRTAAEVVVDRADAERPNMGLETWKNAPGGAIRKGDVSVAKNYLREEELRELNLIVDQYLSFAELQASRRRPMHMADWAAKLHDFLKLNDRDILADAGRVSHALAKELAETQYEKFDARRREFEATHAVSDFDKHVRRIEQKVKKLPEKD